MKIIYVSIGVLINNKRQVLMEKNATNPNFKGLWQFPGGKVEPNETPIVALKRELAEELNIEIYDDLAEAFTFNEYYDSLKDCHYVVLFYLCKKWQGEIVAKLGQEVKWINVADMQILPSLPYNSFLIHKLNILLLDK